MDWRWAGARGRVADWRDRHLLAAAAAINMMAVAAVAAVGRDLDERTRDDPLDDGFERARLRAEEVIRTSCEVRIGVLLADAARELRGIDESLESAALALLRNGWPALPPQRPVSPPPPEVAEHEPVGDYLSIARGFGRRLARLDRELVVEGVRAGARATAVLGDLVRDWTGHRSRVRDHARTHTAELLFVGSPERSAILSDLETAINTAAATARKELA